MSQRRPSSKDPRRVERLFIVRLWREATKGPNRPLRGSVVDVTTNRRFFFSKIRDLSDFLDVDFDEPDT
jgi:hypothetical protein